MLLINLFKSFAWMAVDRHDLIYWPFLWSMEPVLEHNPQL